MRSLQARLGSCLTMRLVALITPLKQEIGQFQNL
jgi:hypothetical protein